MGVSRQNLALQPQPLPRNSLKRIRRSRPLRLPLGTRINTISHHPTRLVTFLPRTLQRHVGVLSQGEKESVLAGTGLDSGDEAG
jgi:hypothetical protein